MATVAVSRTRPDWLTDFTPRRLLANGHLQTVLGSVLARVDALPPPVGEVVEVAPATATRTSASLICLCHWQAEEVRAQRPMAVIVHGLEGSARSQYVVGNANKLWRAGWNIVRMNMRNCGGARYWDGERPEDIFQPGSALIDPDTICPTLYHSGLSSDVRAVAKHFVRTRGVRDIAIIGYSMGGNMVLKLAGELGDDPMPEIRAAVAVSPAADLAASADMLHRTINRGYEWRFMRALSRHYLHKVALYPDIYSAARLYNLHSIREFDEQITAYYMGFTGADDYYARSSASAVVDRVPVPTMVLHALDDPFIRLLPETCERLQDNANTILVETPHGGHCAFLGDANPSVDDDGYWAEYTTLKFLQTVME
ncbi:MAG: alpha/beta fold hydrolase [Acidobacteriaceae bacterium]|nr:alpha/beta fold hydrolase [Acidobacteriaceae bacterium]